ncbi:hypothetical protein LK09_04160 [Microbacterium mangrovi]|uniref:Uncharacterized protein n=1 Tax=Microbacterium mangrovi TaxID=1348253 RepID=A0A0B2A444_9MICO|nr:hypothetical protein [Microbacterium mangrovi]KHK98244.1 hypothetical protein LK09_04160 [Microbacterium mangrovi]
MSRLDPHRRRTLIVALILSALAFVGWAATRVLMWQALTAGGTAVRYSDSAPQPVDPFFVSNIAGALTFLVTVAALCSVIVLAFQWARSRRVR